MTQDTHGASDRAVMTAEIHKLGRPTEKLKVFGVARDGENPKAVSVMFNRRLTDGELRFFHEVCGRSAPLMDGES
jgi:hypothetical protein